MNDTRDVVLPGSLPDLLQEAVEFVKVMFPIDPKDDLTGMLDTVTAPSKSMSDPERVSVFFQAVCQASAEVQMGTGLSVSTQWRRVALDHVTAFAGMVIRLAKYATTSQAVEELLLCLAGCVAGDTSFVIERRDIFATEKMRDELFIPLAQRATTPKLVYLLLSVIEDLVIPSAGALQRRMIFATPAMGTGIFAKTTTHATTIESNKALFTALHCLTCKSGPDSDVAHRRDVFATVAIRDDVFILAAKMNIPDTAENLLTALADITSGDDTGAARRRQLFATDAMVKHVFLPVARSMLPNFVQPHFQVIFNLTEKCDGESDSEVGRRRDLFFGVRVHVIIKASTAVASPASVTWLHRALLNICSGDDANAAHRRDILAFDDKGRFYEVDLDSLFMHPASHATTAASAEAFFNAAACLTTLAEFDDSTVEECDSPARRRRQAHTYFGTARSRQIYVAVGKSATTTKSVEAMLTAFSNIVRGEWGGNFTNPAVRSLIVSKAQHMTSPLAIELVFSLLKELTYDAVSRHVFTTVEMRDRLFLALSDRVTTDEAVLALFTALESLTDSEDISGGRRRCELFTTSTVRDKLFRRLTQYATTRDCAVSIVQALCNLVTVMDVPWPKYSTMGQVERRLLQSSGTSIAYNSQNLYADDVSCTLCDLIGTAEVMDDVFVPINKLLDPVDLEWFFTAVIVPVFGNKEEFFASATMRDAFVLPLARHFEHQLQLHATDRRACPYPPLLTTLRDVLRGDDAGAARRRENFATPEVWDSVFVSCARCIEGPSHAVLWCECLKAISDGDDVGAANRRRRFSIANAPKKFLGKLAGWSTSLHASTLLALLMERSVSETSNTPAQRQAGET